MAARVIAQLVVNATSIFTRAFVTAYQQAVRNAKAGGGAAASGAAARSIKLKMQTDEALKILDIEKVDLNRTILEERYKRLFETNDPAKGGSFYIQSKIFRSKEALDKELEELEKSSNSSDPKTSPEEPKTK